MRVLLSYKFDKNITPLGPECERALQSLGHEVFRMAVDKEPDRDEVLLRLTEKVRPEILFVVIGYNYKPETLEMVRRRHGAKVIGWWFETPEHPALLEGVIAGYDHMFAFSRSVAARISAGPGAECHYVNYGTDTALYRPVKLNILERYRYGADVSFLGKFKERRRDYLRGVSGMGLNIWGPLWKKELKGDRELTPCVKGYRLFGDGPAKLFSATKVNININSWASPVGPNLRVFDIPACGSFLLTEYVEELDELFEPGAEMDTFRSREELADKTRFYLTHDSVREGMADKCRERVLKAYKMTDSMARILKLSRVG